MMSRKAESDLNEISPFAPEEFPKVEPVPGITAATIACGLKSNQAEDLLVVCLPEGTAVAGVFTQSAVTSPSVQYAQRSVAAGRARALVVHAGNANALTGAQGERLVQQICGRLASELGCPDTQVLTAGTGIIGQRIPEAAIVDRLAGLVAAGTDVHWEKAASAICTTDTFAKGSSRTFDVGGKRIVVSGIAKGSGMIAPDMATMLCFIFTNAEVEQIELQEALTYANGTSFQRVTVDGDESTSDSMLLFATGGADLGASGDRAAALGTLRETIAEVAFDLAMQVVSDGEGITKRIEVTVQGASTEADAAAMAKSIAESPLVKTAIAGGHANWGRIAMALGKTHRPVKQDRLRLWLGEHEVVRDGDRNDSIDERGLADYMSSATISVTADVGMGHARSTVWTCDLTRGYIDINAHYVT